MATFKNKTDTPEQLFERYLDAKNVMLLQRHRLQDAYDLVLPNRANFRENVPGDQRNIEIFDSTASEGLKQYANDVQSILMPPYQRWASLVPGSDVAEADTDAFKEELEEITEILFKHLEQSNFYQVSAEAIRDMGISTGIMTVQAGPIDNPLIFRSIAISEVAFSEGRHGRIQNFWRCFRTTMRQAILMWPLKLTSTLQTRLKDDPDGVVELIEGFVLVPGKTSLTDEFQYYVQDPVSKKLMLNEKRSENSWIGFRSDKTTGEVLGYGPILRVLPFIRSLNGMSEWDLRAWKFAALGTFLVENSGVANPFTITVEPGALIPIETSVSGKDPIRPLQTGGQPKLALEKIQSMQAAINKALFSQPLPPDVKSGVSATEISIRQQNWVRQNATAFGRLSVELIEPSMDISLRILSRLKIIPKVFIDRKTVMLKYESPLIAIQDQEDVAKVQQDVQFVQSVYGEQGVAVAFDQGELNKYVGEKLGVPSKLLNSPEKIKAILQQQAQAAQQAQEQQQATPLPAGQVQQPQLPLAQ